MVITLNHHGKTIYSVHNSRSVFQVASTNLLYDTSMPKKPPSQHTQPVDDIHLGSREFQSLYDQTYLAVFRYIYSYHGGPIQEVEDLATQTYLRAWKSRKGFYGNNKAAFGWLLKIARNLVIDTHRWRRRNQDTIDIQTQIIAAPGQTPEELVSQQEQIRTLWSLLVELPEKQQEIIILRYILGWRVKDIAVYLDMGENHVSVLIRRTLTKLKRKWPKL